MCLPILMSCGRNVPQGYVSFERAATQEFRNSAHRQGRLFGSDELSKRNRRKPS